MVRFRKTPAIVLVGNGESLRGKKLGALIDGHREVVRFNHFKIAGFEEDVGRKITIHVHGWFIRPRPDARRSIMILNPNKWWKRDKRNERGDTGTILPLETIREIQEAAGLRDWDPTSGLTAAFVFLREYGKIAICGFDHGRSAHYFNRKHRKVGKHRWGKEAEWFAAQRAADRIINWTDDDGMQLEVMCRESGVGSGFHVRERGATPRRSAILQRDGAAAGAL